MTLGALRGERALERTRHKPERLAELQSTEANHESCVGHDACTAAAARGATPRLTMKPRTTNAKAVLEKAQRVQP